MLAIAALALAPVIAIVIFAFGTEADVWVHLATTVLPVALADTAMLLGGVALVAGSIGVVSAWLVSAHEFPGRRWFEWALLLPLAMPAYICLLYTSDAADE